MVKNLKRSKKKKSEKRQKITDWKNDEKFKGKWLKID